MSKLKNFWEENKKKILVTGGIIIGGTVIFLATKKFSKQYLLTNLKDYSIIRWKGGNGDFTYEKVLDLLEKNKSNGSSFAIFRDGPNPDIFTAIKFGDGVIS